MPDVAVESESNRISEPRKAAEPTKPTGTVRQTAESRTTSGELHRLPAVAGDRLQPSGTPFSFVSVDRTFKANLARMTFGLETVSNLGVNSSPGPAMGRRQDGRGGLLVLFYPHVWDGLVGIDAPMGNHSFRATGAPPISPTAARSSTRRRWRHTRPRNEKAV